MFDCNTKSWKYPNKEIVDMASDFVDIIFRPGVYTECDVPDKLIPEIRAPASVYIAYRFPGGFMKKSVKGRGLIYGATCLFCLTTLMVIGRPLEGKQNVKVSTPQFSEQSNLLTLVKP